MKASNAQIAHLLRSIAAVYLLKGANRFRIIAYENAAETVEQLSRELYDLWENNELTGVSGIGPSISQHLEEYFKSGDNSYLIKTVREVPSPVFVLMKVPGLGAKRAFKLVQHFKFFDDKTIFDDLLKAAADKRISELEGFGEKSQAEIAKAIQNYKNSSSKDARMPLPLAYSLAQQITEYLKQNKYVQRVETLGSLRRMVSTIGDVDLAATISDDAKSEEVIDHFLSYPGRTKTEGRGDAKGSMLLANGRRIDLRIAPEKSFGAMLQYFTGSKAHNIKLREFALKKGFSLSEYGIGDKSEKGTVGRSNVFATEEDFYKFLGMQTPPPEIREGNEEIKLAIEGKLPRLVEIKDLKGDFHIHSNYDLKSSHDLGANSIEEISEVAKNLGYDYFAISDHNPSVSTHSHDQFLSILKKRYEYMKNRKTKVPFFVSMEIDITPDGSLAVPDEGLQYLNMAIVSVHSSFRLDREKTTKRILKALSYPKVKILGHPTGRKLGAREEIDADWNIIFAECIKRNIALEINSWTDRLDLPDLLVRQAKKMGAKFVVDTDAHHIDDMYNMFYGVSVARRGWLEKDDIMNTKSYKEVKEWIEND